jgi:ribose-phosphate pyrophosphokinase
LAIIDKRRTSAEKTKQANVIGSDVRDKVVWIFDDMISTAGSICGAAEMMKNNGASKIYLAATHGVLCGSAVEKIQNSPVDRLIVTDTLPLPPEKQIPKITVLSIAPLLGEAVKRIHRNESVSRLFVG